MTDVVELLKDKEVEAQFKALPINQQIGYAWRTKWLTSAHDHQILPHGDWAIWLLLGGRGAGKTRTSAEQIGWWAWTQPNTRWLVSAPTAMDVRGTCIEGESGLLNVIPPQFIADYNKSLLEIKLINGSLIKGISASEPDRFRGGQYHGAWLDELAAWDYLQDAWDMIMFSVRLGKNTKIIASTTPRPKDLIVELVGRADDGSGEVVMSTASTYANIDNLAPSFQQQILQYEGTKLGRQEIYAELIDPEEGGIVKRDMFKLWDARKPFPKFEYIIQSYDCAYTEKTINDPTACLVFGLFKPTDGPMSVMLIDAWQERMQYPDLRRKVQEEYEVSYGADSESDSGEFVKGKRVDLILVEDKAAGISLIQDMQRAHLPVRAYNPGRADKVQRLSIVANIISHGRVWIPESTARRGYVRDWAEGFVSQICSFPEATHDDYVDACTQALRYLRDAGMLSIDVAPYDPAEDYADAGRRERVNPYAI
jgi:predicted phage terminase large subunit-like protein